MSPEIANPQSFEPLQLENKSNPLTNLALCDSNLPQATSAIPESEQQNSEASKLGNQSNPFTESTLCDSTSLQTTSPISEIDQLLKDIASPTPELLQLGPDFDSLAVFEPISITDPNQFELDSIPIMDEEMNTLLSQFIAT